MKLSRVLGAVLGAVVLTAAFVAYASTPQGQVLFGPGQPVTLTGATAAAPGATSPGGVVIDTVATLTNGYLLQVKNNGVSKFTIDKDGLASPAIASTTSTVTTGNVFSIADTSASQTTATGFAVTQSGTTANYTGDFVSLTGSSTTGTGNLEKLTCVNTTNGSCETIVSNAATTSTSGILALSGTALTSGTGFKATGGGAAMLTGGILADLEMGAATVGTGLKLVTSGTYTDTAASPFWLSAVSATTPSFGLARIDGTGLTTGSGLVIKSGVEGTMTNAGSVLAVSDGSVNTFRLGVDSHMTFLQSTAPVVTSTGGSSASCTDGAGTAAKCTDNRGIAAITTSASTNPIVVTFHTAYAIAPVCVVTPADATTETDFVSSTIKPVATTSTSAISITPAANWAATAHKFAYICME